MAKLVPLRPRAGRAVRSDDGRGADPGPGSRPSCCIKTYRSTHGGILCGPCQRRCEHAGRIAALGEMVSEVMG